jgi:hypothetical protein
MAFDFPNSPTNGQKYPASPVAGVPTYTWDGVKWTTVGGAVGGKIAVYTDGSNAMTAQLTVVNPPVNPTDAAAKSYADTKVSKAGDTMTGSLTVSGTLTVSGGGLLVNASSANLTLNKPTYNSGNAVYGSTAGALRWALVLGDATTEAGGNVGSNLAIISYSDAGAGLTTPLQIARSNGQITLSGAPVWFYGGQFYTRAGSPSWIFSTNAGETAGLYLAAGATSWTALSDARLPYKKAAEPVDNVLTKLASVKLYSGLAQSGQIEMFFKAQELAITLPEVVAEGKGPRAKDADYVPETLGDENGWGIMYDRTGAVALQACRELLARVEVLEAKLAALKVEAH